MLETAHSGAGPEKEGSTAHRVMLAFGVLDPETRTVQPGRYHAELDGVTVAVQGPWKLAWRKERRNCKLRRSRTSKRPETKAVLLQICHRRCENDWIRLDSMGTFVNFLILAGSAIPVLGG